MKILTKVPLTLERLEKLCRRTEQRATPHRIPDFEAIRAQNVANDAPLRGRLFFLEENNTGGPAFLERWQFFVFSEEGKKISFWADLLPGSINAEEPPAEKIVEENI